MIDLARHARRIVWTLFGAQSLASSGFIAAATLNAILGARLAGGARWAGLPSAVQLLGGAAAAFLWGYLMDWLGRRGGIALGLTLGVLGAVLSVWAVVAEQLSLFLGGMLLLGISNAAMVLGRFAAAEVSPPAQRGRAISNVVLGGTIGSILGPLLITPTGILAQTYLGDELAGGYLATIVLLALGALVIFLGLRPDPRELGRAAARLYPESTPQGETARPLFDILRQPAAAVAVVAMVLGQVVMVMVMAITSVHMRDHQHGLGNVSLVFSAHTFGMFAFSVISGRLSDRWGRGRVILFGSAVLLLACLAAPLSPHVIPLTVALFLLGLGWNFCFVGGSTLLADQLSPAERARTQGFNDLLVGLASAIGSLGSGLVYAAAGYTSMALAGAVLSLVPLLFALAWLRRTPALVNASPP